MPMRKAGGDHPALHNPPFQPLDGEHAAAFDALISEALDEDVGREDVTTNAVIDARTVWEGDIVARASGVIAGLPVGLRVFTHVEPRIRCTSLVEDGASVAAGTPIAHVAGPARGLLTAERVALNFIGRLSGIATLTHRFVQAAANSRVRITDTRKTTPNLRELERYAVRAGGGYNHRMRLDEAVLIKDNHLEAVGSIAQAVQRAREYAAPEVIVEVECETPDDVREAVEAGADAVLLDNMRTDVMERSVAIARGRAAIEASGGMSLDRMAEVAASGVDMISIGALTHSAPSLDVALDFVSRPAKSDI
jgi:nicotinate-nucleotide pyrophosphorylase (carboxylating)